MECLKDCGSGRKNNCKRDTDCFRVAAIVESIITALENPPYTATLPDVVVAGGITLDQWRAGYRNEKVDCFKRSVEAKLGGEIVYQQGRVVGKKAVGVRRLAFLPRDP